MPANPFIASVYMFGGNFAPRGYAFCDGQLLPIAQNTALFSLIGTIYGGDGVTTFALPDLRSRAVIGPRSGPGLTPRMLGQKLGGETSQMTIANMPGHTHALPVTPADANAVDPTGNQLGTRAEDSYHNMRTGGGTISSGDNIGGGGTSFNNLQPYTVVNYIIALQGTYPSRS